MIAEALDQLGKGMEHAHWDWRNKIERAVKGRLLLSAVECGGEVHGLIAVASAPRYSVVTSGANVLYVDYIEKAPWNIRTPTDPPRYEGVETVLLADAIARSLDLGWEGRIGLHSLPSADGYYRKHCGMDDLGEDPAYYDLRYFEFTVPQAKAWRTSQGITT